MPTLLRRCRPTTISEAFSRCASWMMASLGSWRSGVTTVMSSPAASGAIDFEVLPDLLGVEPLIARRRDGDQRFGSKHGFCDSCPGGGVALGVLDVRQDDGHVRPF